MNGHDHGPGGFFEMSREEFMKHREDAQNHIKLSQLEFNASMNRFLDSLNAEQMVSLEQMIATAMQNAPYLPIVMGQITAILRVIHKVCEMCRETDHDTEHHLMAPAPRESVDLQARALNGLSVDEIYAKLNIVNFTNASITGDVEESRVVCRNCQTEFNGLVDRIALGTYCPGCAEINLDNADAEDDELEAMELLTRYGMAESSTDPSKIVCLGCMGEFTSIDFRIAQGEVCPLCLANSEK